ncbi:hypothetical protein C2S51_000202 [Perilla frutescens var. frutescens]|nr:hypothetical protein C2S51_000202 [Perilla frutescens var. frutescens]
MRAQGFGRVLVKGIKEKATMKKKYSERGFPRIAGGPLVVSERSLLWWLESVRQCLDKLNLAVMRESCFKHIIRLPSLEFHAPVYQELLWCLDKRSVATNTLHFMINGEALVFGPTEFVVMTGLKFNRFTPPPTASVFHDSVFGGKPKLLLIQLQDRFRDECELSKVSSPVCLRLAFLYVLYSMVLMTGRMTDPLDMIYFHLVEDLDAFNAFPWGLIGYNFLVQCTHQAHDHLESLSGEALPDLGNQLLVPSFSFALLFWAYEKQVPMDFSAEERRILNLTGPFNTAQMPSTPFPSLDHGSLPTGSLYSPNVDVRLQNIRIRMMVAQLNSSDVATDSTPVIGHRKRTVRKAKRKGKRVVGDEFVDVAEPANVRTLKGGQSTPLKPSLPNLHTKAAYERPILELRSVPPHMKPISATQLVDEVAQKLAELQELDESRSVPCRKLSFDEVRGSADVAVGDATESRCLYTSRLDLLSVVTLDGDANFTEFVRWYKLKDYKQIVSNCTMLNNIPILTRMSRGMMREWFDKLWNLDGWLQDQYIDALLAFILRQARAELSSILKQVGASWIPCAGVPCSRMIGRSCKKSSSPLHMEVMLKIVACAICPMKDGHPQLFSNKFEVWAEEDPPQQVNGSDYGIMALQFMDCLFRNHHLSSIIPSLCQYRRKMFCSQLFEFSLQVIRSRFVLRSTNI